MPDYKLEVIGKLRPCEKLAYIRHINTAIKNGEVPSDVSRVVLEVVDEENIDLRYYRDCPRDFDRIRRITGYLVGSIDRWNDAKRAEERDRIKHGVAHV